MKRKAPEIERQAPETKPVRLICPTSAASFRVRIKNDTDWLAKHWHEAMKVQCPRCQREHSFVVKDIYLSEAIANDKAIPNLFAA